MRLVAGVLSQRGRAPFLSAAAGLCLALSLFSLAAGAAPRVPASDAEVVATLPAVAGWLRDLRKPATAPRTEAAAITAARAYLQLAREQGDARFAGYALGALQPWQPVSQATPGPVLVMHATVAQFVHDFDGAERTLKLAVARDPRDAQAWITLATVLRVRGRYAESDQACRQLERAGPPVHAAACLAENQGLRGDHATARAALARLLQAVPAGRDGAGTRQWLLTTLAEVEERAGRDDAAEAAYRQALAAERDGYTVIAYSDLLLRRQRPAEALALLAPEQRSDAVLLRRVIAAQRVGTALPAEARAIADKERAELSARLEAAAQRPGVGTAHARELALFALDVQQDPARALAFARLGVTVQREPLDVLLLARAAAASGNAEGKRELQQLLKDVGLRDARIAATS